MIGNEVVWYLSNENDVANSVSNEDEDKVVLIFWSDRAYLQEQSLSLMRDLKKMKWIYLAS